MMSIRDFLLSTKMEPNASVSASSCGSVGFSGLPPYMPTIDFGASRGAISMGPFSSSGTSVFCFFPCFSFLSKSFFRFSDRFALSVSGSLGSLLSGSSRIVPPSPSESESSLSLSNGMILLLLLLLPTGLKMSWLNHRAMRCSARSSNWFCSSLGTMAVLVLAGAAALTFGAPSMASAPVASSESSSGGGPFGPSSRASKAPPSIALGRIWTSRRIRRSKSLSLSPPSSSSSLSLFFNAISPAALCWMDLLNSLSSPAHAARTRWRRVSFFALSFRCILLRIVSKLRIFCRCNPTAISTSIFAKRFRPSSESLSDCGPSSWLDSSLSLPSCVASK
mmetsp:Transcript_86075/g.240855  ORF Transcript_86075/g.240855 Transcript_86075/m.240855 type:complete len:335 (+) Transcript_86075:729-1733(+)